MSASLFFALSGCNDQNVGVYNTPPSVAITNPLDDTVYAPGDAIMLEGVARDDQQDSPTLDVSWTSSLDGELGSSVPDIDGVVSLPVTELSGGVHAITLSAIDLSGEAADATVTIEVGYGDDVVGAPTVVILGPNDGDTFTQAEWITVVGSATDDETPYGELQVSIISSYDGLLWDGFAEANGAVSHDVTNLTPLQTHVISLTAVDGEGKVGSDSISIYVDEDGIPSVTILAPVTGDSFWTTDLINLQGQVSDDVDDAQDLELAWQSDYDGVLWTGNSDSSGTTSHAVSLTEGVHNITLFAVDTEANEGSASVSIEVIDPLNHDNDGDGQTENEGDCDDDDAGVYTGNTEVCDEVDNNCDGMVNEPWWDTYEANESSSSYYDLGEVDDGFLWAGDTLTLSGLTIHEPNDEDWFHIDVDDDWYDNADFSVQVTGLPSAGSWTLELWDANGTPAISDSDSGSGKLTVYFTGSITDVDEDDWLIRVYANTWTDKACTATYSMYIDTNGF
ncbi:MAG TPA: putative metal-binding motif-containing protein [Myxococcota bacterium]|nr:putative metal-binding motif-containing protein [Myxococcota bacterium]